MKLRGLNLKELFSVCKSNINIHQYRYLYFMNTVKKKLLFKGNSYTFYTQLQRNCNFDNLVKQFEKKIIYNSVIEDRKIKLGYVKNKVAQERHFKQTEITKNEIPLPLSLKYIIDNKNLKQNTEVENELQKYTLHFPFATTDTSIKNVNNTRITQEKIFSYNYSNYSEVFSNKWMSDYEVYPENKITEETESWKLNYGTPNPDSIVSNVPCGGCGALLHCKDTSIPGYLPSEIFENESNLKAIICQRCHFLKNYKFALQVKVNSEDYLQVLDIVREKHALVILIIDLLDFPCSVWPGVINIIGVKRPIIIVGNKVDLLPKDSKGYLNHIKKVLVANIANSEVSKANIKHISLISAKTGFGIEELITKLQNCWEYKGDVFLMGCVNVGKSTLFNALLESDYCKIQAVDLIQRATTSQWPGTTLNLLKFPILRPSGWRKFMRTRRLISQRNDFKAEEELRKSQLQSTKNPIHASLIGHLGRTFTSTEPIIDEDVFSVTTKPTQIKQLGINEKLNEYSNTKWCYDTPGVVQSDQIIHLLTTEELTLTLPRKLIQPRTYLLKTKQTLFIGGLSRLDYLGECPVRLTVFSSVHLPITICDTINAHDLYKNLLGTSIFQVPYGTSERLLQWPPLKKNEFLKVIGENWRTSCADIVLSSSGWISVTAGNGQICEFTAWTPEGRGIYLRKPALLPYIINLRGKKIRRSPAYKKTTFFCN